MQKITSFDQVKNLYDYLRFKYIDPSYGGLVSIWWQEQKTDDDIDDLVKMPFIDTRTNKIYHLYVHDVEVQVENKGTEYELFCVAVKVSNLNFHDEGWENEKMAFHVISSLCPTPCGGSTRTEYAQVQCIFHNADLSVFDGITEQELSNTQAPT